MWYRDKQTELTADEALAALVYGVNGLIPKLKGRAAIRAAKKAKELLNMTRNLLSEGIAEGIEDRA
jgi:hypothetical protein